ncbi:ABC transporter substrate-binding protein [Streptosporangium lutulentum]
MPAHVVEKQAGLSEDDFIAAVKATDAKKLEKAIKFFNDGWVVEGSLPAADLIPSNGPYKLSKLDAGQSLTFVANDKWWGAPAATPTIVERFIALDEQAQALQNREVQIVEPQPGPDVLNQLKALEGVKTQISDAYTYEHLDFNFDSSPFKDKALREAFAKCVPRQLIVDNLIKPVAPDAKPLEVRNVAPFQTNAAAVIAASGGAASTPSRTSRAPRRSWRRRARPASRSRSVTRLRTRAAPRPSSSSWTPATRPVSRSSTRVPRTSSAP